MIDVLLVLLSSKGVLPVTRGVTMAGRALLVMLMPLGPQDEDAEGPALMLPLHSFLTSPCFLSTLGLSGYSSLDMATETQITACP